MLAVGSLTNKGPVCVQPQGRSTDTPDDKSLDILKALASEPRWRILQFLAGGENSINEIAQALSMPPSTVAVHVKVLEDAGLVHTELRSANHGLQKVCTRVYDNLHLHLPYSEEVSSRAVEVSMPIGAYTRCEVTPTCGLASETALIGYIDDPLSFYEPDRARAGLIWFTSGYLEYSFPNRLPEHATLTSIMISMEICSEAPMHNNRWPSDITLWINGREIGTWRSPGDFGGERGRLTPRWWNTNESQYGLLKRWLVNTDGAYIDGHTLSALTVQDLEIDREKLITVRLGVKDDALNVGGINLFGRSFGNYPQDIALNLEYNPGHHWTEKRTTEIRD